MMGLYPPEEKAEKRKRSRAWRRGDGVRKSSRVEAEQEDLPGDGQTGIPSWGQAGFVGWQAGRSLTSRVVASDPASDIVLRSRWTDPAVSRELTPGTNSSPSENPLATVARGFFFPSAIL